LNIVFYILKKSRLWLNISLKETPMQIFGLGRNISDMAPTDIAVKTCRGQWELSNATQLWALRNGFSRISFGASDQFDMSSMLNVFRSDNVTFHCRIRLDIMDMQSF